MTPELATILRLVGAHRPTLVNVGHGRSPHSAARAQAFIEAWEAGGGTIGATVSWPPAAASWLRPACRLVAGHPDAWVIADDPAGFPGMAHRLIATGIWRPTRTIAFYALADPALPALAGPETTEGLCGAHPNGTPWTFTDGHLTELLRTPAR